jgi:hypothetical protein
VASAIQPAKTCFQVPLPRRDFVLVREAHQHRQEPLLFIEDHHAFLIEARCNAYRLKGEGHAAA